jgi:hypothetical protein
LSTAWKWDPLSPKWLRARGTNLIVEEVAMGLMVFKSFLNLAFSAALSTKSELLQEEDKHDFFKPEATTRSMDVSNL